MPPHIHWVLEIFLFLFLTIVKWKSIRILVKKKKTLLLKEPMHSSFFSTFSFVKICYVTVIMLKMLLWFCTSKGDSTFLNCEAQVCFVFIYSDTRCLLLTVMPMKIMWPFASLWFMSQAWTTKSMYRWCLHAKSGSFLLFLDNLTRFFSWPFWGSSRIHDIFPDISSLFNLDCWPIHLLIIK